jgi:hypothetical protein
MESISDIGYVFLSEIKFRSMISFDQPIISDVRDRPNVEEIKESKTNFQDVNIFQ